MSTIVNSAQPSQLRLNQYGEQVPREFLCWLRSLLHDRPVSRCSLTTDHGDPELGSVTFILTRDSPHLYRDVLASVANVDKPSTRESSTLQRTRQDGDIVAEQSATGTSSMVIRHQQDGSRSQGQVSGKRELVSSSSRTAKR